MCFSNQYEKEHIKEFLIIIERLSNYACRYNTKVSECDFYVMCNDDNEADEKNENSRYYRATHCEDGKTIKSLTIDELFKLIDLSEEDLASLPLPKINANKKQNNKAQKYFSTGSGTATLADLLRSKGYDLDKKTNAN